MSILFLEGTLMKKECSEWIDLSNMLQGVILGILVLLRYGNLRPLGLWKLEAILLKHVLMPSLVYLEPAPDLFGVEG